MKPLQRILSVLDARDKVSRWQMGFWLLAVIVGILVCSKGCTPRIGLAELRATAII